MASFNSGTASAACGKWDSERRYPLLGTAQRTSILALRHEPTDPGKLILGKRATFSQTGGIMEIWAGVWQIDGDAVSISVKDLVLDGAKFFKEGAAVLKLTGDGVSTIKADSVDLKSNAFVDVGGLKLKPGRYTLMQFKTLKNNKLALAKGTDPDQWALELDKDQSSLILIRK